ncbi:MAG: sigma-70 family RNA polymerase sigma factor [Bryobacteraceae bacterium]|jgi:DNA-directed RNA polymerase specialized sigma24 family protein
MTGLGGNERFLDLLDRDPREAERKYNALRCKLVFYFQHNGCSDPEDPADEVFSRVLRRNTEAVDFYAGLSAYCFGIAEHILREQRRRPKPEELPDDIPEPGAASTLGLNRVEQRVLVQQCLQGLPISDRRILLRYYQEDRVGLAKELRTTENGLRIRVFRIKRKLEENIAVHARAAGTGA